VQLVSKISNLCDPDPPTLQTHSLAQTDYALVKSLKPKKPKTQKNFFQITT